MTDSLKALVFDLSYDRHFGVVVYARVFAGELTIGQRIRVQGGPTTYKVERVGVNVPEKLLQERLANGEIGWFTAGIRNFHQIRVGNTLGDAAEAEITPLFLEYLAEYFDVKPNIYCNLYSSDNTDFLEFSKAIKELQLQDSGLTAENTESPLLGRGFRCGFIGVLQQEIICARLQREFGCEVIATLPTTPHQIVRGNGEVREISNPSDPLLDENYREIRELFIELKIITPLSYLGGISQLCRERRGVLQEEGVEEGDLLKLTYQLPFSEFVGDFHDRLKLVSQGYASCDYSFLDFRPNKIVKVDIYLNGKQVPDLSFFSHQDFAYEKTRETCQTLKENLSRHNFQIAIQGCIGKKIIARETIAPLKKNVTGNMYGGDRTRKMKLWEKQKAGKKRMKEMGQVSLSVDDLRKVLKKKKS